MTAAIEVRGLGKRRGDRWVVDDVAFAVAPGEIVALVGGNGAGKSTTLAMITGALAPDSGRVLVAGEDLVGLPEQHEAHAVDAGRQAQRGVGQRREVGPLLAGHLLSDNWHV